jgi:hypothetical protein
MLRSVLRGWTILYINIVDPRYNDAGYYDTPL